MTKRYMIVQVQDNINNFGQFVAKWLDEHPGWEPVGGPFKGDFSWNQAMFRREAAAAEQREEGK